MINIIAELPDGCIPVTIWMPHPEGGFYCVDSRVYGLGGRLPRFVSYPSPQGEYMSSEDKADEAKAHLGRAGRQGRNAAKNTARAAQLAATPAAEAAEEVVDGAVETAKRFNPRGLAALSGDTGTGFLALSVALYAGVVAYNKFGAVIKGRSRAVSS